MRPSHESTQPLAALTIELLYQYGMRDIVIAPGSRSAPLTLAAVRHGALRTHLVYDERSAAYTALGIAQQTGIPAGVICSSGTAAVNFAPAIVEAYYQRVPLVALTADRPPEWIDQIDNQAIRQNQLYATHVRASFVFPVDDGQSDTRWHAARIVSDAWAVATATPMGPVHINFPLREPLYRPVTPAIAPDSPLLRAVPTARVVRTLTDDSLRPLVAQWCEAKHKLIVVGQHGPDARLHAALTQLLADSSVVVLADSTANLGTLAQAQPFAFWEAALATQDEAAIAPLLPELAIWVGGQITSKRIKALLRAAPPRHFWRVDPDLPAADAFQANTHVLPLEGGALLSQLTDALTSAPLPQDGSMPLAQSAMSYADQWRRASDDARTVLSKQFSTLPFCEAVAVQRLLAALPPQSMLQLGNSMPIRLVNLLGLAPEHLPARIDGNRGASGIDGTVSTAVGAAIASAEPVTLLVGDLGFFYDRNGLWQRTIPANLRIVLLNNHGGGIFDVIEGPNSLTAEERGDWFLTPNPLTARRTAEEYGLHYWHAADGAALTDALHDFFQESDRAALLEIETDIASNTAAWRSLMEALRGRTAQPASASLEKMND